MSHYQAVDELCSNCGRPPTEHRQCRDNKPPHCPTPVASAQALADAEARAASHPRAEPSDGELAGDGREVWVVENSIGVIKRAEVSKRYAAGACLSHEGERLVRYVPEAPASSVRAEQGGADDLAAWKRLASSIVKAEEAGDVVFRQCQWSSEWSAEFYRLARKGRALPLPSPPATNGGTK